MKIPHTISSVIPHHRWTGEYNIYVSASFSSS